MSSNRRTFVAQLSSLVGAGALGTSIEAPERAAAPWDLSWLEDFKGKHRQVFDLDGRHPTKFGNPLRVPRNWMNAHRDVYSLGGADLNTCVGITSECFPMNAGDPLWTKYPIGEHWEIKDPETGQWATRNIWLGKGDAMIPALQARGTVFWQCSNALNGVVNELATLLKGNAEQIHADLFGGLAPGVKLVPAHTMLVGLVQERRFSYQKL